jgi:hypothetical protein
VKDYPKDGEYRRFKLSRQIVDKPIAHIEAECLSDNDLFFAFRQADQPKYGGGPSRTVQTSATPKPTRTAAPTSTAR